MSENVQNKKNTVTKVIVSIVIVTVIIGIFLMKTAYDKQFAPNDLVIPLEISSVDLEKMKAHQLPIILDFGADSCVPCKQMAPVLVKLNSEMQDKAVIQFLDIGKYTKAASNFPVQVIPTQIFYTADGKPYVPKEGIGISFKTYVHKDTGEHLFTVHEGGLTESQMRLILLDMGVK